MKNVFNCLVITMGVVLASCSQPAGEENKPLLFKHADVITGMDDSPLVGTDILVNNGRIVSIGQELDIPGATIVDLTGKTVIPGLISAHVHVGTLRGTGTGGNNFDKENVLRQLHHYAKFGVLHVQSLGTDRLALFQNGLFDSINNGQTNGARMLTAGWGFGVEKGAPPFAKHDGNDNVFRPENPEKVKAEMQRLSQYPLSMIKIWVDDFGNPAMTKMNEATYKAIIEEAAKYNLRVAAHLYYLNDAKKLAEDGVAIFAHSVRDTLIDDATIQLMKQKGIAYVPTLTLDEFAYIYGEEIPDWLNDPFFKASLEPGVYDLITSEDFRKTQQNPAIASRNKAGFGTALQNVKKLHNAGILVGMGTDSGAQPVRAQGFAEHRELALLVKAGLTPLQAIKTATINSAKILNIDKDFGSLEEGKIADFIVLDASPLENIKKHAKDKCGLQGRRKTVIN